MKGQRCYTSPPSGFGTKERGRNVQGVLEVGRKLPSALTHIVTAPLDQILKATATLARPQDALEFVLNGAVLEVDRGRSRRKSVIRVGAVWLEECRITRPSPRPLAGPEVVGTPGDANDVSRPGSDRWRCRCWVGS